MKNITKAVLGVVSVAITVLQVPAVHAVVISIIAAHPDIAAFVAGVGYILALLHDPKASA